MGSLTALPAPKVRDRGAILAVLCLSLLIVSLDNTVLNVAIPDIVRELNATSGQLQWVIDHAKEEGLKSVAELRLASLLLDAKDNENAMKVLEDKHPASFDALFSDMKGDVLVAQGKPALARAAYQQAYDKLDSKNNYRNLVQMKMDALGAAK